MLVEAIRRYLMSLGVEEAAEWSEDQILRHVDDSLKQHVDDPDAFLHTVDELAAGIVEGLLTVQDVLARDLH